MKRVSYWTRSPVPEPPVRRPLTRGQQKRRKLADRIFQLHNDLNAILGGTAMELLNERGSGDYIRPTIAKMLAKIPPLLARAERDLKRMGPQK